MYFSPTDSQLATSYGSYGSTPHSFPNFHHPSHELLQENNFVWHVYHKYHAKCLKGKINNFVWHVYHKYHA